MKLPLGSVKPAGWLAVALRRQREGLAGRLPEVSAWLQKDGNAWLAKDGRGKWGWEEAPYWLRGAILLGQLTDDPEIVAEAEQWIRAVLDSQRANGHFGPLRVFGDDDSPDLWANMVMLACLQSYHEYTDDPRVLDLMGRYFRYQIALPDEKMLTHFWQYYRGGDNLESVYWLYNRTGEEWLLDLAEKIHLNTADWSRDGDLPNWHGVNIAQSFGEPATYYLQSGSPTDLEAAYDNFRVVRDRFGQFPGGMFAADENAREGYHDPRQAVETCAIVEQLRSDERLLAITGDPLWADHIEDVAFNAYPAAVSSDFRSLRYLTSPNLVSSDSRDYSPGIENIGPMFTFNPISHRCCQHNHTQGWPRLVEHAWMATHDNGLCAAVYGPSVVKAVVADGVGVSIEEKTRYPFEEAAELEVTPASPTTFPLYLRVPGWSDRSSVSVNDATVAENVASGTYVKIVRRWHPGDKVTIRFPMDIVVRRWRENQNSVSVSRGPLTYALDLRARKVVVDAIDTVAADSQWRPDVDLAAWTAFELQPSAPWNYGLLLDKRPDSDNFTPIDQSWPDKGYPFAEGSAPVAITCRGRRVPEWTRDLTGMCARLQHSPVYSGMPTEEICLVPMGSARLRISAFPEVSDNRDIPRWRTTANAQNAYTPSASYCSDSDSVDALADGLLPCASSDQSIPRLTFRPRVGGKEWMQADFDEPRRVSHTSVYWCDDESRYDHTPTGGFSNSVKDVDCRVPSAWRLLYLDGDTWRPVRATNSYGTLANRFNSVRFSPVRTSSLRVEVQLAEDASAGALEWTVGESARKVAAASSSDVATAPDGS